MDLFNIRYVDKLQKPQRIEALTDGIFAGGLLYGI